MLNIDDIARLVKVSRTTVSRVLNDEPGVRESTKQKVLQVIREQIYHSLGLTKIGKWFQRKKPRS